MFMGGEQGPGGVRLVGRRPFHTHTSTYLHPTSRVETQMGTHRRPSNLRLSLGHYIQKNPSDLVYSRIGRVIYSHGMSTWSLIDISIKPLSST